MNVLTLKRDFQDLSRLKEIITILVEEGYHAHLAKVDLARHAKVSSRIRHAQKRPELTPDRVRTVLERLGPTFVKLGQVLSLRPDLVPHEYTEEFRRLQDDVPVIPFRQVRERLEKEAGKVFRKVERKPLAAASIAQVHAAELDDGTEVVLKVQRPGVRQTMERDIDIMTYLAKKIDKHYPLLHAGQVVEEFKEYTERELDFTCEAKHLRIFREFFKDDADIVIPEPHEQHSTGKLLVMERIRGIPVSDLDAIKKAKIDLVSFAKIGERAFMQQAFRLGMFHADPHPGNLMAVKRDGMYRFAFLDFGIVGVLDDHMQKQFLQLLLALSQKDAEGVSAVLVKIGSPGERFAEHRFLRSIDMLLREYTSRDSMTKLIYAVILAALDNDLSLPTDVITGAKAFVTVEGAAKWIYPEMDMLEEVKPFFPDAFEKQYGPEAIKKDLARELPDMEDSLRALPSAVEKLVQKMQEGNIELRLSDRDTSRIARNYDLEADKRNYIFLAGMIFIGSAIVAGFAPQLSFLGRPLHWWGFLVSLLAFCVFLYASMKIHKYQKAEG